MDADDPAVLLGELQRLRDDVEREGRELFETWRPHLRRRNLLVSGTNLAHYLALRRRDVRPLQLALQNWGLSSLGRSEGHVLSTLDGALASLAAVCGRSAGPHGPLPRRPRARAFTRGRRMLDVATRQLFGPDPPGRRVRIMVTLSGEAATDEALIPDLARLGVDCFRINCAHDGPDAWERMVALVRAASEETGRGHRILMDLGGPKPRTGDVVLPGRKRVVAGDRIWIGRAPGCRPEDLSPDTFVTTCTLPEALTDVGSGARVWVDDGKIGATVVAAAPEGLLLEVTEVPPKGAKLKAEKGLNFPGTHVRIPALTERDLLALDFVVRHADLVGYSFVQTEEDMLWLRREIEARTARPERLGIVAKIETETAVLNLPEIIVHAAGSQPFAVMIARGDLAIEIGYRRLAEIQEEILWFCEAAHVPVVWATQVLEGLVKKGRPSRAEMTDAAAGERAECVMLNKGPFQRDAVRMLHDVLARMEEHHLKRTGLLRPLAIAKYALRAGRPAAPTPDHPGLPQRGASAATWGRARGASPRSP